MNTTILSWALMSGIFFAFWALALDRSGIKGILAPALMSICQGFYLLLFANIKTQISNPEIKYRWLIIAALLSGTGMWLYTRMIALATPQHAGGPMAVSNAIQIAVFVGICVAGDPAAMTTTRWLSFGLIALGIAGLCRG